ncbi:MAG: diacylglycerol kinase family protein [Candidatus Dojkabacteria bacterium]|jgi:diacylglycerol kinase|nr:diacylglycerol kinase family protein [Candidatus Dojkabacteria bacterium]MDD4561222.1 diacylglycerol kinase family protein [Candidatus Dojkabacteria bacterium]
MKNIKYQATNFFKSQGHARSGIKLIFKNERNFRIDLIVAIIVVILGFLFKISHTDWIAISLVISVVFVSETINSAIEALCDTVSLEYKVNIKYAKDVSAGAVLVSALVSVITGLIVFVPYIVELVKNITQ